MRALLIYPELPPSFWSLRGSLKLMGRKTLLPPLSLITVAALLPREWEFRLVDLNTRDLQDGDWEWADLVLLTGMMVQREGVLSLMPRRQGGGRPWWWAGHYPTSLPQEILDAGRGFSDSGRGGGDHLPFSGRAQEGQQKGVFKDGGQTGPDHLPHAPLRPAQFCRLCGHGGSDLPGLPF